MGHGATSSGKYYNGCTKADINKGCYGKLSSDQLSERIDLHARRLIEGRPTVVEIANHWMDKHGFEMSYQSEKKWCATPKNKALIEARAEEMRSGGALTSPAMSAQTLINSLVDSAKASWENCKQLRTRLHKVMGEESTPWSLLGLGKDEYLNALGPRRKDYDAQVTAMLKTRKDALDMAVKYSSAHTGMSKEFRENVKQAYEMAKFMNILQKQGERKRAREDIDATVEEINSGETLEGNKFIEIDESQVDAARKALGYEDN